MIFRIYPTRDTTITNDFREPSYSRLTGSNLGASEELDVFKRSGISGVIGSLGSSSLGRILMQFDLSPYTSLTGSGELASSGVIFRLRMNHKTTAGPRPTSFDLTVAPISSSWDEGVGRDVVELLDDGVANWEKRTAANFWNVPGGDFLSSPTFSSHFDSGIEDIDLDITTLVNGWISGTIENNGLAVMMTSSIETDALYTDYYQKKFYSRQTDFRDRAPYIEARYDDSVRDDRVNLQWSRSGTLFLYNAPGGTYENLPANFVTVAISDASGVLMHLTASRGTATGIYSASFALPTGAFDVGRPYSGSVFYDSWGSGSFAFATGTFAVSARAPSVRVARSPLTVRMRNLEDEYTPEDSPTLGVIFRRRPQTVAAVRETGSLERVPQIMENAYYAIENESTRERVVPFGTGSQNHTRLSYDADGNNFRFFMRNLHPNNAYRIIFLVVDQGSRTILDPGIKFRVI